MIQKTIKMQDETAQDFQQLFEEMLESGRVKTLGGMMDELIEHYKNPRKGASAELQKQLDDLQAENEQLKCEREKTAQKTEFVVNLVTDIAKLYNTTVEDVYAVIKTEKDDFASCKTALEECLDTVEQQKNELATAKTENEHLSKSLEEISGKLLPNDVICRLSAQEHALLDTTLQRLSEKHGIEITGSDLLRKIFLRYTIERYTEWFYKFVISDRDIEQITGISVSDWKAFLNGKNQ